MTTDFATWVAANPPPDLHDLVRAYGSYWGIPEDAWRKYLADMKEWQLKRQDRFWR
jgi:hypothetical protein